MKISRYILVLPILSILALAACSLTDDPEKAWREKTSLLTLQGTYLGFSPTDESAVKAGEIEIVIDDKLLKLRMATGLKIHEEEMNVADFEKMSDAEVGMLFRENSKFAKRAVAFKYKPSELKLLFFKDPKENEFGLIVKPGGMLEMLGPTVLFSPEQVKRGDFDRLTQEIESQAGKGVIPRLRNNGKAEK